MQITVTRSGGIAGALLTATVDTDDLAPDQAGAITSIASETAAATDHGTMMPDAFQYDVTIVDRAGTKTMCFHGDPCPASALFAAIRDVTR
jgi:emfourin